MTFLDMCETISKYWKDVFHHEVIPMKIYEYSPTGELFMIFEWYNQATMYYEVKNELKTDDNTLILMVSAERLKEKYEREMEEFKKTVRENVL